MSYDPILGGPRYSPSLQHSLMGRRHSIRVDVLDFILVSYFVDNCCGEFIYEFIPLSSQVYQSLRKELFFIIILIHYACGSKTSLIVTQFIKCYNLVL